MEQPQTRQELYEILRTKSREEFILEQMIRLGFWPAAGAMPEDPADEIRRRGEIQRELKDLRGQLGKLYDEQALVKEMRKRRMVESRAKQRANKERRIAERHERAEQWAKQQETEVLYLGAGVSGGLNNCESDTERLARHNLPVFHKPIDLATAMGILLNRLCFLAYSRKTSTTSHYIHFKLPKKTGGERSIHAPKPELKAAQHWILNNILNLVTLNEYAHGFRPARSIVSNARPHIGADVLVNFDLQDFFPTIRYPRVKGVFRELGYSEALATVLALLCTAPDFTEVELDGQTYFVANGERHLPQGAPTSPAITNILCRRLDRRLGALAESLGDVLYTRYADDLTFSARGEAAQKLPKLCREVRNITAHEGLTVNESKTRILRPGRRQEVTGLTVNEKLSVDRKMLHKFRATLFHIEKDGPEGKRWGQSPDLFASLMGYANFVAMVDKEKGADLKAQVQALAEKHGWRPASKPISEIPPNEPPQEVAPDATAKKWWKLW